MAVQVSQPRKRADVKWKQIGKDGILLDLKSGDYFEVDEIALAIWKMLNGKSSLEKIASKLAKKYGAPEKTIQKDLAEFISELKKKKLLDTSKG